MCSIKALYSNTIQGNVVAILLTYSENAIRLIYGVSVLLFANSILGDEGFALFAFYLVLAQFIYGMSKFSLDAYSIRRMVQKPFNQIELSIHLIVFRCILSCVFFLIVCLVLYVADKVEYSLFILLVAQFFRSFDSVEWLLRANGIISLQAFVRITSMLFVLFVFVYFNKNKSEVSLFVIAFVQSMEWLIIGIIYTVILTSKAIKRDSVLRLANNLSVFKVIKNSMPAYIAYILFLVYSKVDQLFLQSVVAAAEYGKYMIAARINEASVVIVLSLNMVLYPRLLLAFQSSRKQFEKTIRHVSIFLGSLSLLLVLVVWCVRWSMESGYFVNDLFPKESVDYLSMLIFSAVPMFIGGLRSSYYTIINRPEYIFYGSLCGFICSFLISVPLMYMFGIYGAVIGYFTTVICALFVFDLFSEDRDTYFKVIACSHGQNTI